MGDLLVSAVATLWRTAAASACIPSRVHLLGGDPEKIARVKSIQGSFMQQLQASGLLRQLPALLAAAAEQLHAADVVSSSSTTTTAAGAGRVNGERKALPAQQFAADIVQLVYIARWHHTEEKLYRQAPLYSLVPPLLQLFMTLMQHLSQQQEQPPNSVAAQVRSAYAMALEVSADAANKLIEAWQADNTQALQQHVPVLQSPHFVPGFCVLLLLTAYVQLLA